MLNWTLRTLELPLNYTWKISRNASTYKINFLIEVSDNQYSGIGEVAPNIRYGETSSLVQQEFQAFHNQGATQIKSMADLSSILSNHVTLNALRFGIESAYIHYLCKKQQISIASFLQIPECTQATTSYTIPILPPDELEQFYNNNRLHRFSIIKLKINTSSGVEALHKLSGFTNQPIIIDPNEAFTNADEVLQFLEQTKNYNLLLLEQPMPADKIDDYVYLKANSNIPVMADESICDGADFNLLKQQFDVVNMKLMKAGGYLNGIRILKEAQLHGMKTMIGCMVETSIGIGSALNCCGLTQYADLDGFMIVKDEPFKQLIEKEGIVYRIGE
ncbi:MAG: hypothetical protein MUC81_11400 [Bacteroidia bacterium]|jgi:L-alanine-DL-glutamate epimerase-like enolase superfamily enzyme|nr:hypothetical protein [Bacteroidia bacterium]